MKKAIWSLVLAFIYLFSAFVIALVAHHFGLIKEPDKAVWSGIIMILLVDYCRRLIEENRR